MDILQEIDLHVNQSLFSQFLRFDLPSFAI